MSGRATWSAPRTGSTNFDSGWRFYAGDESEAYLDEVANCVMEHLAHAVERWSEVADLVADAPSAGHWLWDAQQRRYREI